MENELSTDDIARIIAQANSQRIEASGELIAVRVRKALTWIAKRADRFLHAFLMSPV